MPRERVREWEEDRGRECKNGRKTERESAARGWGVCVCATENERESAIQRERVCDIWHECIYRHTHMQGCVFPAT